MVSVRRPTNPRTGKRSLFRSAVWLVIGIQSVLLISKYIKKRISDNGSNNRSVDTQSLTKVLQNHHKEDLQLRRGGPQKDLQSNPQSMRVDAKSISLKADSKVKTKAKNHPVVEQAMDKIEDEMLTSDFEGKHKKHDDVVPNHDMTDNTPDVLTKDGSGPAKLGYVVDLVQERNHAGFRNSIASLADPAHLASRIETVARKLDGVASDSLHSCSYWSSQSRTFMHHANCRDTDTVLTAYNHDSFPRYVCGHKIGPREALKLDHSHEQCGGMAGLITVIPNIFPLEHISFKNVIDSPPISVVAKASDSDSVAFDTVDCDIPCRYDENILHASASRTVTELTILGTDWIIRQSKVGQFTAKMEQTNFRHHIYYSSISHLSSVPLSYYDSKLYKLRGTKPIDFQQAGDMATYLIDSDCTAGRRHKWLAAVEAVMKIESFGSCSHNTDLGGHNLQSMEDRLKLMRKNRIVLAFEAEVDKDYITNVVWEALLSGAVPAIYGASNLKDLLPHNSAILASQFDSWDAFAERIHQVSNDRKLWDSYQTWRTDEDILQTFEERWKFTDTSPECRTCRWAYAKQYGLGWNHTLQTVQENLLPRTLCLGTIDKHVNMVIRPFQEIWGNSKEASVVVETSCTTESSTQDIQTNSFSVTRQVVEHDGIVDMLIHRIKRKSDEAIVLRLEMKKIRNTNGAYFRDTHTMVKDTARTPAVSSASIQDEHSKVTILANWVTEMRSSSQGIIEIVVLDKEEKWSDDEIRRIRVISEDINPLHDKMTEYFPSTFAELLIRDFVDPLELYYET